MKSLSHTVTFSFFSCNLFIKNFFFPSFLFSFIPIFNSSFHAFSFAFSFLCPPACLPSSLSFFLFYSLFTGFSFQTVCFPSPFLSSFLLFFLSCLFYWLLFYKLILFTSFLYFCLLSFSVPSLFLPWFLYVPVLLFLLATGSSFLKYVHIFCLPSIHLPSLLPPPPPLFNASLL